MAENAIQSASHHVSPNDLVGLTVKDLEHVLIEKVEQLFWDMPKLKMLDPPFKRSPV
jgi:hypothetical protein